MSELQLAFEGAQATATSMTRAAEYVLEAAATSERYASSLQSGGFGSAGRALAAVTTTLRTKIVSVLSEAQVTINEAIAAVDVADVPNLDEAKCAVVIARAKLVLLGSVLPQISHALENAKAMTVRMGARIRPISHVLLQAGRHIDESIVCRSASFGALTKAISALNKTSIPKTISTIDRKPMKSSRAQLEKKYKHAEDFGVEEPRGKAGFEKFELAMKTTLTTRRPCILRANIVVPRPF